MLLTNSARESSLKYQTYVVEHVSERGVNVLLICEKGNPLPIEKSIYACHSDPEHSGEESDCCEPEINVSIFENLLHAILPEIQFTTRKCHKTIRKCNLPTGNASIPDGNKKSQPEMPQYRAEMKNPTRKCDVTWYDRISGQDFAFPDGFFHFR